MASDFAGSIFTTPENSDTSLTNLCGIRRAYYCAPLTNLQTDWWMSSVLLLADLLAGVLWFHLNNMQVISNVHTIQSHQVGQPYEATAKVSINRGQYMGPQKSQKRLFCRAEANFLATRREVATQMHNAVYRLDQSAKSSRYMKDLKQHRLRPFHRVETNFCPYYLLSPRCSSICTFPSRHEKICFAKEIEWARTTRKAGPNIISQFLLMLVGEMIMNKLKFFELKISE